MTEFLISNLIACSISEVRSWTFSIDNSLSNEQSMSILKIFSNFNDTILPTFLHLNSFQ